MKRSFVFHPLLLALYPPLAFFIHNLSELEPGLIFIPVLIIVSYSLFFWLIINLIFRNLKRSAIFVSLFLIFFFSYGHVSNLLQKVIEAKLFLKYDGFFLLLWLVLFLLTNYFIFKKIATRQKIDQLTKFLNIFSLVLVLLSLGQLINYSYQSRFLHQEISSTRKEEIKQAQSTRGTALPDIYYLIFDRYASAQSLKDYYNYDNGEFINFLTQKGFYVANQSYANYPITDLSLASSLNMEFLDLLSRSVGPGSGDFRPLYEKFTNHQVGNFLKSKGYLYYHLGSTWWPTSSNKNADVNYRYKQLRPLLVFLFKFLETTALYPLYSGSIMINEKDLIEPLSYEALTRETTLDQLEALTKIPDSPEPKFVFAHVLLPHEPYVFDQNGRYLSRKEAIEDDRRKLYLNQLIYTNKLIEAMIEKLLVKTKGQAIIILQADEGPFPKRYKENEYVFQWNQATIDELKEKLSILNAYYLPNINQSGLYPSITPVNTFRLVFNLYLRTNLPLLPDDVYVIKDRKHPYQYINVTNRLR